MPIRTAPAVTTRSNPPGRWRRSPGSSPRAVAAVRTSAAPAVRFAIDADPHGPGRGHLVRAPGDADGPHAGAVPAAAMVPSSPPAPGGDHRVRPRAVPAVRTSARSRPRPWSRARRRSPASRPRATPTAPRSPTAPGGGHRVRASGRCRRSARRRGSARGRRPRGRRRLRAAITGFDPPGDAGGPHVGRPGREVHHRCRSAWPRP